VEAKLDAMSKRSPMDSTCPTQTQPKKRRKEKENTNAKRKNKMKNEILMVDRGGQIQTLQTPLPHGLRVSKQSRNETKHRCTKIVPRDKSHEMSETKGKTTNGSKQKGRPTKWMQWLTKCSFANKPKSALIPNFPNKTISHK